MYAAWAIAVLISITALVLLTGLVVAARQAVFLRSSYVVQGRVVSEWCYRLYGRNKRYYRVQFKLSNGQSAELRSAVAGSAGGPPHVGETVPVRVRETDGKVKARIGTTVELWFESLVLLFLGGIGSLTMFAVARQIIVINAF